MTSIVGKAVMNKNTILKKYITLLYKYCNMLNLTFFWLIDYNNVTLLMITCNILKPKIFKLYTNVMHAGKSWNSNTENWLNKS